MISTDSFILYEYKGVLYDYQPKGTYEHDAYCKDGTNIIKVKKKNYFIDLIVIILCIASFYYSFEYSDYLVMAFKNTEHIMSIPSEMYYIQEDKILNVDVTNDMSNLESIKFKIYADGKEILDSGVLRPGESIGGAVIDLGEINFVSKKLNIEYETIYGNCVFKYDKPIESLLVVQ